MSISRRALVMAALLLSAEGVAAQESDPVRLLARADSAFAAGDSAAARVAYQALLAVDPGQSRAVYQLAMLAPAGGEERIAMLRRYTEMEPDDAWGFAALAEAHRDAGELPEARTAINRALALVPDAADIQAVRDGLGASGAGLEVWLEPLARAEGDSDGNAFTRLGMAAAVQRGVGSRIGVEAARLTSSDGLSEVQGWEAALTAAARPHPSLRLSARAGVLSVTGDAGADFNAPGSEPVKEPVADARVRYRPEGGPALELRGRHGPITATPLLLAAGVTLSEMRGSVEVPLLGSLYARGVGRWGRLAAAEESNTRSMIGVGPVLRLSAALEVNALAARSGYREPSAAGYFAYERVDAVDVGVYWEDEKWWPLSVALDAGAGMERITRFSETPGGWGRAARLWSLVGWAVSPGAMLRLELEAYETRAGEAVAADDPGTGGWRWGALTLGLSVRP